MDETKQRFEAEREREDDEGGEEEDGGADVEFDEVDDDDGGCGGGEVGGREQRSQLGEFDSCSLPPIEAQFRGSQSETLANSKIDLPCDFVASSHQLSEVPVDYALLRPLDSAEFKDQVGVSHQQAVSVTTQAAQVQSQNQLQSHGCPTSSPELSPNSATQSLSSAPSPTLIDQKLSPVTNASSACMAEVEPQNSSDRKTLSAVRVVRTPSIDGFNWRKYGQKQVKSPQGSRSYYKCTYSDCYAKKIECCDHSNLVIEIISKGQHNHDPPRRINCTRESRSVLSSEPNTTAHPVRKLNDSDPSTSSRELIQETQALPEAKKQNSSDSDGTAEIDIKEEHVDEPEPKRRVKKSNSAYSDSLLKPGKKPKFVVHAAGDVGISGDGYRWRKYGQKMVKGNPHPRNYYRCTSAGCPVRKHIERAVESTNAVIITYKGVHDHDMPVPKKRHGPPSAPLVAAAAAASMNNLQSKKTEPVQNQNQNQGKLLGSALFGVGEYKAAVKALEEAIYLKDDYADAHCDLASALHAMGDDDNAVKEFQKAIDLKPGHVDALYNLGGLYMDMGRYHRASEMYTRVLGVWPNHWRAQLNKAVSLLGAGETEEAKKALKEALKMTNRVELHDAILHLKQLQKKKFKGNGGSLDGGGDESFIVIEPSKFKTVGERTILRQELANALDIRAFQRITRLSRCDVELLKKEMTESDTPVSYSGSGAPEKSIRKASLEVILHRLLNFLRPETFVGAVKAINQKILSVLDETETCRVDLGMFFAVLAPICSGSPEKRKRVAFDALLWRPVNEDSTQIKKSDALRYIKLLRAIYIPAHGLSEMLEIHGDTDASVVSFTDFLVMFDDPDWGFGIISSLLKLEAVDRNRHGRHVCSICRYPIIGPRFKEMKSHFSLCSQCYSEGKVPPTFKQEEYRFKEYATESEAMKDKCMWFGLHSKSSSHSTPT